MDIDSSSNKLIIIPTYNERETIKTLIKDILIFYPSTDILVVDDSSPDETGMIIDNMSRHDLRIKCLHRGEKRGIGPAYVSGFKWAFQRGYEYILCMDADYSHHPKYIPILFENARNHDLVIASRYIKDGCVENWSIGRKILSRFGSFYARTILGIPVKDMTTGFKCFKRHLLEIIETDKIFSRGYAFLIETTFLAYKKGAKIKEIPFTFIDRYRGKTKMTFDIFWEAIFSVWHMKFKYGKINL